MGKIFGISNLPVFTIDKALSVFEVAKPVTEGVKIPKINMRNTKADVFVRNANAKPSIKNK